MHKDSSTGRGQRILGAILVADLIDDDRLRPMAVLPFSPDEFKESKPCLVGVALRGARIGSRLSIGAVAERTRIRAVYLEALEEGRLDQFVAPIYAIGFARSYAQSLGLDADWAAQAMRDYIGAAAGCWRRSGAMH